MRLLLCGNVGSVLKLFTSDYFISLNSSLSCAFKVRLELLNPFLAWINGH